MARRVKEKIRQLWIIHTLLDCNKWKQQDLRDELVSNTTLNIENLDKSEKKNLDKKISKMLGILEVKEIIVRKNDTKTRDKYCWLVKEEDKVPDALKNILEIINSIGDSKFSSKIKNDFMNSNYAKTVINMDLVKKFENNLGISLEEDKEKKILFILNISPTALLTSLNLLKTPMKLLNPSDVENFWNSRLQDSFLRDINLQDYYPPYPIRVKYEVKLSVDDMDNDQVFNFDKSVEKTLNPKNIKRKIKYEPTSEYYPL